MKARPGRDDRSRGEALQETTPVQRSYGSRVGSASVDRALRLGEVECGRPARVLGQLNGIQAGDPFKLAQALVTITEMEQPPLRFIAGSDAIAQAEEKLAERQEQIDALRGLSSSLHGANVVVVARRRDRLDTLVAEIEASGATALAVQADITDRDRANRAVQFAVDRFGRLDILINNAGLMLLGPVVGADVEEWERMIAVNQSGLLYVTHAALPHLLAAAQDELRGVADIVNISSIAGRRSERLHRSAPPRSHQETSACRRARTRCRRDRARLPQQRAHSSRTGRRP